MNERSVFIFSVYRNDSDAYVRKMLDSIKGYNKICVVDGEIDGELNDTLTAQDMVILRNEENRGLAYSMNRAIKAGMDEGYEFYFRIDADDASHEDRVPRTLERFDQDPSLTICGTWCYEVDEFDRIIFRKTLPHNDENMKKELLIRPPFAHPTVCFRRSFFEKVGFYDESLQVAQDYELWFRAAAMGVTFANVPEYLYYYRKPQSFYEKYRSVKRARTEFQLHLSGLRSLRAPPWSYGYPIMKYVLRRMPLRFSKFAYENFR